MRPRGRTPRMRPRAQLAGAGRRGFNEAAGAYPADAWRHDRSGCPERRRASMRPRGRTPRMREYLESSLRGVRASMRPRGRTPRMRAWGGGSPSRPWCFNEAAGAYPADASESPSPTKPWSPGFNEAAGAYPADAPIVRGVHREALPASMRPRGRTPRMRHRSRSTTPTYTRFNEAAGAYPADAEAHDADVGGRSWRFNEAAGAYPADARSRCPRARRQPRFNEAAGAYPADAPTAGTEGSSSSRASFNEAAGAYPADAGARGRARVAAVRASMRPRGRTPRMHAAPSRPASSGSTTRFNEAAGAYPADASAWRLD